MGAAQNTTASAQERFRMRALLGAWNQALDRADLPALRRLTLPDADFAYEDAVFRGDDALECFVAARMGGGEVVRRTHVNHLQAWHHGDGFRTRAMAMIVHMHPATTPFADGAPSVAWVGYTEDLVRHSGSALRVASRRFVRWDGSLRGEGAPTEGDA